MEISKNYESYKFFDEDLMRQLNSDLIKESEILDEEEFSDEPCKLKEDDENRPVFIDDLFIDEDLNITNERMKEEEETKGTMKTDVQADHKSDDDGVENNKIELQSKGTPADRAANSLLRRTILELERALNDTNALLAVRDAENNKVRAQLIIMEKNYEDEILKRRSLELEDEEKDIIIRGLEAKLENEKMEIANLKLWIENNKDENAVNFVKETICATPEEIDKIREMNIEQEKQILELKMRVREFELERERENTRREPQKRQQLVQDGQKTRCKNMQKEQNLQTKLRMKFMRDAFFYFMIDYHAEEQLRAILAILEYEDRRQDIIIEAHKMRQQGRKFSVSQVSSRKFTFVQEELR